MLIFCSVTPTNSIRLSNECVLIFLWPVYFCITPFRVTSASSGATVESHVSEFCDAVFNIRQNISFKGDGRSLRRGNTGLILTSAARECCDVLEIHLTDRLRSKHLATFSLLHSSKFAEYNNHFPTNSLASTSDFF